MFCSVEHRNKWVPHGHNLSGILYFGSTIRQHKVNNYSIGLPIRVTFLKVLDYSKEQICIVGGTLLLSSFTMASKINNAKNNILSIYSGAQKNNQEICHDGGPIPKEADPINSGIGHQPFDTL